MKKSKMKKWLATFAGIILMSMLLFSCAKEKTLQDVTLNPANALMSLKPTANLGMGLSTNCNDCVAKWADSKVIFAENKNDFYIEGWNDGTRLYLRVYRLNSTFTRVTDLTVTYGGTVIYGPYDSPTGVGAVSEMVIPAINLPSIWSKCDAVSVTFTSKGVGGGGGKEFTEAVYRLRELCTTTSLVANPLTTVCVGTPVVLSASVTAGEAITGGVLNIIDGTNTIVASVDVTTTNLSVNYTYIPTAAGTSTFTANYVGSTGYSSSSSAPVTITAEDCGCDESFTYVQNQDGTYTFSYTPKVDMTGVNVVFTFAQADRVTVTGLDGWNVNGATRQKTMDMVKCQTYSWTVGLTPNCSGHSGQSNIWTDFKVGDISKKNSATPTIVSNCP